MSFYRAFACAITSVVCPVLSAVLPQPLAAGDGPGGAPQTSIDCRAVGNDFAQKLGHLMKTGKTVEPDTLKKQLEAEKTWKLETVASSTGVRPATEIYADCRESVVLVGSIYNCGKCSKWHPTVASGFVIGSEGIIVTNYHVIAGSSATKIAATGVRMCDGSIYPVKEILASNKLTDLAVLKIEATELKPLPVADDVAVGTRVYCIGHPERRFYTMTEGIVSGDFKNSNERREISVTCDYAKGSSGGPILDQTGAVVGIVRVTHTVYANKTNGIPTNVQMTWKFVAPCGDLLKLLQEQKPASE
jgi:serine protease Do